MAPWPMHRRMWRYKCLLSVMKELGEGEGRTFPFKMEKFPSAMHIRICATSIYTENLQHTGITQGMWVLADADQWREGAPAAAEPASAASRPGFHPQRNLGAHASQGLCLSSTWCHTCL